MRGVELAGFLARTGGKLRDEVFVSVAQGVGIGGEVGYAFVNLADDGAKHVVLGVILFAELAGGEVDLGEESAEGVPERVFFDMLEGLLERVEQFAMLRAGHLGDVAPEVFGLDDVVHAVVHFRLESGHVLGVLFVPVLEWCLPQGQGCVGAGILAPEQFAGVFLVVAGEVAQEEEGEHIVSEVVGVHRASQFVGYGPEGFAQGLSVFCCHVGRG